MESTSRKRQRKLYRDGFLGRRSKIPIAADELERRALRRLSRQAGGYLAGGAGVERTMAANRAAFDRYRIVQRMLRDVSRRDLSLELFGRRWPLPFALAPIGVLDLAHRDGDLAVARAAAEQGILFLASSQSSFPLEEIAEAGGTGPRWFQLYWSSRDELAHSFVTRAERAGYEAIVVTLDTTELGWRPRDLANGYLPFLAGRGIANYLSDSVFEGIKDEVGKEADKPPLHPGLLRPGLLGSLFEMISAWSEGPSGALRRGTGTLAAARKFLAIYSRPDLQWSDLERLRTWTSLPILLKGILHPADARRALETGVNGLIVSNHGGRQVDGATAALDALPQVVRAAEGKLPVLFDSGIRCGADMLKALALGADAVLLGRPYAYGLALGGEAGVRSVITNFAADFDANLGLSGHVSLAGLGPDLLHPSEEALDP